MLSQNDAAAVRASGRDPDEVTRWLRLLRGGSRHVRLLRPAVVGDGILEVSPDRVAALEEHWARAAADGRLMSFVPASGAATRLAASLDEQTLAGLPHVASGLLGLDPGRLPKALLPVHDYGESTRTPLQEQLVEAVQMTRSDDGRVRMHFTVGAANVAQFKQAALQAAAGLDAACDVSFSVQAVRTDTPFVNAEGDAVRGADGALRFRPGGHGALLHNLNALCADVVLVKNIDNVVVDRLRAPVLAARRQLVGLAVQLQDSLRQARDRGHDQVRAWFAENTSERIEDVEAALARPIRVCGMVPVSGQPGGGPFWTEHGLQIVEGVEIDMKDPAQRGVLEASTHFNPVELALVVRDLDGRAFDLRGFVDGERALFAEKQIDGDTCRVVEHPGLWNGAMSNWITVFVQVPSCVFAPIKTAADLLSDAHKA